MFFGGPSGLMLFWIHHGGSAAHEVPPTAVPTCGFVALSNLAWSRIFPDSSIPYFACCSGEKLIAVQDPMFFGGPSGLMLFWIHHGCNAKQGSLGSFVSMKPTSGAEGGATIRK